MNIQKTLAVSVLSVTTGFIALPRATSAAEEAARPAATPNHSGLAGNPAPKGANTTNNPTPPNNTAQNNARQPNANQSNTTNSNNNNTAAINDASKSARHRTQLLNSPLLYGGVVPVVSVPNYGYVPYNGFDFGYGYGENGYVPNPSDYGANNTNTADTSTPPPAAPASTTSNPDADAARNQMITTQASMLKEFTSTEEYKKALADVRKATDDYNAAAKKVAQSSAEKPEVKKALAEQTQAEREVDAKQAAHQIGPTTASSAGITTSGAASANSYPDDLTKAAQKKLEAKTQIRQASDPKMSQDPEVQAAKQRLDAAVAHFDELKSNYEAKVMANSDWQAAKQKLDTATAAATPSNKR